MAETAHNVFAAADYRADIEVRNDTSALQPGAALAAFADLRGAARLGADQAGAPRRRAEAIGRHVAHQLLEDLHTGATLDRYAADQIIPFAALDHEVIMRVVDKFLMQLEDQLHERRVEAVFTTRLREHLAKEGFDPLMGARPMQRLIQDTIRRALADELLFGKLVDGGSVTVDLDESGKVTLDFDDSGKPPSSDAPDKQEVELVD